jgi:broad specificity phosphatase PhoE
LDGDRVSAILDCGHEAAKISEDAMYGECVECGRPNIIAYYKNPKKESETARLVAEMEALPDYRGWYFSYEYPGYFCYVHPDNDFSVFFTPDWEGDETLPIEVQDDDGHCYEEHSNRLPLPRDGRTGQKIFEMVRPTLDKILEGPGKPAFTSDAVIDALAEEAANAACKLIQDRLGVTTGDLAAAVLSDGTIERELARYIRAELDAKR